MTPALILAAALAIAGCGSSGGHSASHTMSMANSSANAAVPASVVVTSAHAAVQVSNFAFSPKRITVKVGTHITWTNHDKTAHTATANNHGFGTGTIAPGASKTVDFKRPGVYKYHCLFHAFMTGTVVVKR